MYLNLFFNYANIYAISPMIYLSIYLLIYSFIYLFLYTTDIFSTKNDIPRIVLEMNAFIPRIFLEQEIIYYRYF